MLQLAETSSLARRLARQEGARSRLGDAILFDLDGTLIDSAPDLADAIDGMLASFELPPAGEDRVRHWVGHGARALVLRALQFAVGSTSLALDAGLEQRAHREFERHYAVGCTRRTGLYPGALELLGALSASGIPMALVTNKPVAFTHQIVTAFGLGAYFPVILGGDSLPERKPHPAPIRQACEALGVSPDASLIIGDSVNDVEAARAAGAPVLCVTYGYNHGEPIAKARPDGLVDSLHELVYYAGNTA